MNRGARLSPAAAAVLGVSLLGFALRLSNFGQGLYGDELSTAWIVSGHGLGNVLSAVRSTDEITPPLYFVLAWASSKLGSNPEWLRLPSLVAGTASIPLLYLVGSRLLGRAAGVAAAALLALSPFMIYYSTEARAYSLMIAFLLGSTLSLLYALEGRGRGWWIAYAVASAAAMYSHYTAAFPLAAQALWALCAYPGLRREVLLANAGAALLFVPWLPGYLDDQSSPTTKILSVLSPIDPGTLRVQTETWAVGFPYVSVHSLPQVLPAVGIGAGVAIGIVAALRRLRLTRIPVMLRGEVGLVVLLVLATPVGELVYSLLSVNVYGARNLNSAWPGLALAIGGLVASAPGLAALAAAVLVFGGYGWGAARATSAKFARPDYPAAARLVEDAVLPGDVVIDASTLTPVPLTGLDSYLPRAYREYRLGMPTEVDHPFTPFDAIPDQERQVQRATAAAHGRAVAVVERLSPLPNLVVREVLKGLPPAYRLAATHDLAGVNYLRVSILEP